MNSHSCLEKFLLRDKMKIKDGKIEFKNVKSLKIDSKIQKIASLLLISLLIIYELTLISLTPSEQLKELSNQYIEFLSHSNLASNWSERYTCEPHLAGLNEGLAQYTADKFSEYGFKSRIEPINVYINYPKEFSLKLLGSKGELIYQPTLIEDKLEEDPTTKGKGLVPAFHGYSANGLVDSEFVFANYGTKEDFDLLKSKKVPIKDKVVIVRYGRIFRGLKVKFAEELGAAAVLMYSDPSDDYDSGELVPYPDGPGRNPSSIQRGSVQYLSNLPGDPSRFLSQDEILNGGLNNLTSIPKIPSLPISYKEVIPILKELNGKGKKLGFKGGIEEFDYSTGPSIGRTLTLYNNNDYKFQDIHNVYGLVEGKDKSKVIVLGNHRDSWIKGGAGDPNSGSAVLLEIARALKNLFDQGFKPNYSILLASWDGEEYGLLGSTAFAEKYSHILKKEVVAYINLDAAVTGTRLKIASSPLLDKFLLNVADKIKHPLKDQTLKENFLLESKISILGSGSDYTSFFEHLGITSVDLGFSTGKGDAVYHYHSNYDSFKWISTYGDPGFLFHNTLAQYIGLLVLELSENKLLYSFNLEVYSKNLKNYFNDLIEEFPKKWPNNLTYKNKKFKELLNETNLKIDELISKSIKFDYNTKFLQQIWETDIYNSKNPFKRYSFLRKVYRTNDILKHFEKNAFLHEDGLDNRSWFKHIVFASGRYTGYAGQRLPGLTEAVEDLDFENAVKWTEILKESINKAINNISF